MIARVPIHLCVLTEDSSVFRIPFRESVGTRTLFCVRLYIIKLMLNEWLRGSVISGRSYSRCIIPAVNSGRLFIQEATVGSRFLAKTRDRPSSSLSLTLSFVSLATLDHAKFPNSCHHDPAQIFSYLTRICSMEECFLLENYYDINLIMIKCSKKEREI